MPEARRLTPEEEKLATVALNASAERDEAMKTAAEAVVDREVAASAARSNATAAVQAQQEANVQGRMRAAAEDRALTEATDAEGSRAALYVALSLMLVALVIVGAWMYAESRDERDTAVMPSQPQVPSTVVVPSTPAPPAPIIVDRPVPSQPSNTTVIVTPPASGRSGNTGTNQSTADDDNSSASEPSTGTRGSGGTGAAGY